MATLDRQVGASSDDCVRILEHGTPYFSLTSTYAAVGYYQVDDYKYGCGLRFTDLTIPKGATITAAYLKFTCQTARSPTTVNSRISAEKADNPLTFADDGDAFDTRFNNHTTARVDWDSIPAWTLDTEYQSPEIKTVIQEIVNRAGWASGNALVLFWEDFDDRSTHASSCVRQGYSYDGSTIKCAELHIEYTPYTTFTKTYTADALFKKLGLTKTLDVDTVLKKLGITQAVDAHALFVRRVIQAFLADAVFKKAFTETVDVDALLRGALTKTFTADVRLGEMGVTVFTASVYFKRLPYHVILDAQYITETPEANRVYVIGSDAEGNPVYGTSHNQDEIDLVGERLDFTLALSIPTSSLAADVADAMLKKHRLTKHRGFITIPPNAGAELWDVIQVSDKLCAQSSSNYRVVAISFDYHPRQRRYQHKLILGAP